MENHILSDLIISKVNSITTMYNEEGAGTTRTDRPCWAVIIKYEGETVYRTKDQTIRSNKNNIVLLPKGCTYEWTCTRSGHYAGIEFDSDKTLDRILSFPVSDGEKFLSIFRELEYKRILKSPLYELECIKEVYSLLLKLNRAVPKSYVPTEKQNRLRPAIDFIAKNYNTIIRNDDLADLTGLSTVYFRRLFTEVYGMSPITYIHTLRIRKAKEMLRSDYGNITDIALTLGYTNIYDFSRVFKKYTGISPSQYASLYSPGIP